MNMRSFIPPSPRTPKLLSFGREDTSREVFVFSEGIDPVFFRENVGYYFGANAEWKRGTHMDNGREGYILTTQIEVPKELLARIHRDSAEYVRILQERHQEQYFENLYASWNSPHPASRDSFYNNLVPAQNPSRLQVNRPSSSRTQAQRYSSHGSARSGQHFDEHAYEERRQTDSRNSSARHSRSRGAGTEPRGLNSENWNAGDLPKSPGFWRRLRESRRS
ncbi:hypothetical protein RUND412_003475 [Rhizina undulata]